MKRFALAASASMMILAACGNDQSQLLDADLFREAFRRDAPAAKSPEDTARLVATALRVLNEPVMLAILEDRNATAIMVPYGQNGPVETWTTEEFQSIAFHRGVVTATRGLGDDLMSAEVAAVADAIRSGGGQVQRTWRTLDGTNAVIERTAVCAVSSGTADALALASGETVQTRRVSEDCGDGIGNVYWVGPDGRVVQSRQWLGTAAGYLTQQLVRR